MSNKKHISVALTGRETLWGYIYLALELLILPSLLHLLMARLFPGSSEASINFLYYAINFTAVCIIFRGFLKRNASLALASVWRTLLYIFLGLLGYWAATLIMNEITYYLMPNFSNVNDDTIARFSRDGYFLMVMGTVLLVPTAEECLFRGLLFRGLYGWSRIGAYLISALCFCAIHVVGYIGSYDIKLLLMCFVQYLPAGLVLAWSYEKSNTILTSIFIHAIVNAIGIYAMR